MVKLTIYGDKNSSCTQRVLILLEELDLNYEFKNINLKNNEHKENSFLEMNPFGQIPVVKYDERTLFESRTILKYISKANKDIHDFYGNILVDMWLEIESNNFNQFANDILQNKDNKDVNIQSLEKLEKVLDVYNDILSERDYISSNNFTIADISHIPIAHQLMKVGYKDIFKSRTNVYNWLKRIMKRDAAKRVLLAQL